VVRRVLSPSAWDWLPIGLLITLIPILSVMIIGLGWLALAMFSTVAAVNLYLGEQATTANCK